MFLDFGKQQLFYFVAVALQGVSIGMEFQNFTPDYSM